MNVICRLRGHRTEYRFVGGRYEATVTGNAPRDEATRLARLCKAVTPVREVCTRCDVIVWESDARSFALSQDQEGSPVSAPQPDPIRPSATRSGRGDALCWATVERGMFFGVCGARLLPGGGCANRHRHVVDEDHG